MLIVIMVFANPKYSSGYDVCLWVYVALALSDFTLSGLQKSLTYTTSPHIYKFFLPKVKFL